MRITAIVLGLGHVIALSSAFMIPSRPSSPSSMMMKNYQPETGGAKKVGVSNIMGKAIALSTVFLGGSLTSLVANPPDAALADGATTRFVLPPVDTAEKGRCQFKSSAMGQANGARDKLFDLRLCDMSDQNAAGFDLSGAILAEAKFQKVNFKEAVMSKAYAQNANFEGADFTSAVVDRVSFDGSKMKGTLFVNTVLSGTSFKGADLQDSDFTDAYLGSFDLKNLCKNPTLQGTNPITGAPTKESAGCR